MLKRFMTWLLRKLQGLMGTLNGKRSSSQPPEQGLRDNPDQASQQRDRPKLIDTSRSTVSIVEHLPNKPAAEPDNGPANDSPDATIPEPDTHRRLDAAASAPPTIETVTPSFPTTVSELISSPLPAEDQLPAAEENITPTTSVRSLKKVQSDQLPSIHDVLPAVDSADSDPADAAIAEPSDLAEQEPALIEPVPAAAPIADSTVEPALASDQPVLFSFDITERAGDELLAEEPVAQEPVAEELLHSEPTREEIVDDDSTSPDVTDAEPAITENPTGEILIEVPLVEAEASVEAVLPPTGKNDVMPEDAAENLLGDKAETLPYPWSLPVPEARPKDNGTEDTQTTDTQPSPVDASDKLAAAEPETVTKAEPTKAIAQDNRPVKNGIVKLLFTLKEGNHHGYIAPDDGSKDILFHQKYINADIFPQLERGVAVTVLVKYVEGKAYATRVDLL